VIIQERSSAYKRDLLAKIADRSAVVGVVGLGYVGLPFAVEKAKVGFRVVCIEQNPLRAEAINRGESYIPDVRSDELKELAERGLIHAVTDFRHAASLDAVVICVPTPLTKNRTPDLQHVESVTRELCKVLRPGQLVSLESTTYPGTTDEVMLAILSESGLKADEEFFLAHSPERVDPGNLRYSTKNTNKVVGGVGPHSLEVATMFYSQTVDEVIALSSTKAAELTKVFENTFRAVNIALVNELMLLCDRMNLNVWEVLQAAYTKPFGIMPFYPGPGVGGHCIPIDPHYLEWKAKELNFNTHFIALAGEINRKMPQFVAEKATRLLNSLGKAVSRSRLLVMGVAYKKQLGDCRESPALDVIRLFRERGAEVRYHDPYVGQIDGDVSQFLTEELVEESDLVLITTDHENIDYEWLVAHAQHVLDTRNATRHVREGREKITLL